jgi:PTS hybrid protein
VTDADQDAGVVLLFDLGSARMTAEMVVETLDDPSRAAIADAPLVEGAVAAAVASAGGADLPAVIAAAEGLPATTPEEHPAAQATITLTNESGLHARPAAMLARAISDLNTRVTIQHGDHKADATSVLAVMSLAANKGDELTVTATGTQAAEAINRIQTLATNNFHDQSTPPPS